MLFLKALSYAPAHFDDVLDIGVRCAAVGRSSIRFVLGIYRGAELLNVGELVYVYAETAVRKSIPLPDSWRATIAGIEKIAPETA